jgi:hypothetical protein
MMFYTYSDQNSLAFTSSKLLGVVEPGKESLEHDCLMVIESASFGRSVQEIPMNLNFTRSKTTEK